MLFLALCCLSACNKTKTSSPVHLQCEHLENPLGIDSPNPRLSWQLGDSANNSSQTAYQIFVDTDSAALSTAKAEIWNSGKITSDSILVTYSGEKLKSFTKYFWKVVIWDQDGQESSPSAIASFETAMMDQSEWKGEWITDENDIHYKPAPYFRKEIDLNKKVTSARAYITAAGLYELYINGNRIGNHILDPIYTRFDRRNLYTTYDITNVIQQGKNAIGILLGNGWYNHQSTAVWFFDKAPWRDRPRVSLHVRITYDDGSTETLITDSSWKTTDSPTIFNSIYTAEHYDARKEIPGWNKTGLDDSSWKNVKIVPAPSQHLVAQQLHPIRVISKMQPVQVDKKSDTCYVFSFPKNIAGIIEFKVKGESGTEFRLKHGERLHDNGYIDLSNIDLHYRPTDDSDPFQTDIFILNGNGEEYFSPKFNYKGFQYVEIRSSKPVELTAENLTAIELHSDLPLAGYIHSSNPTINKIWKATNNSYMSNLFGYPTDCPQREKNGWTGDAHIAAETGLYSFDGITVYEKWMADHRDEQQPNGVLPSIIPTWGGWGYDWGNGPDWTSTVAIIPWELYLFYGDKRPLFSMYDNIKLYVDYITSISPDGTTDWGLGDWVPVKTVSSKRLTSSLYYFADVCILAKTAELFGKKEDHQKYTQLSEKIRNAINNEFLNKETGIYCSGSQTEQSTPLYWGVVPEELKEKVAQNLYAKVEETGFHLDVGILGAKAILNALTENGYPDAAYKIASQETFPSWGHWIVNGATSLYENWPLKVERNDASLNHIMFGEIGAWLYKGLGGIYPDEKQPGFKNIILKPNFAEGLDQFEACHQSPYGKIISSWKKNGERVNYKIRIPANSGAILYIPRNNKSILSMKPTKNISIGEEKETETILQLRSGEYNFEIEL